MLLRATLCNMKERKLVKNRPLKAESPGSSPGNATKFNNIQIIRRQKRLRTSLVRHRVLTDPPHPREPEPSRRVVPPAVRDSICSAAMVIRDNLIMGQDQSKRHDALADVDIVLSTRIFIADDVEALGVRMKWAENVTFYMGTNNRALFKASFQALRVSIVSAAKKTQ